MERNPAVWGSNPHGPALNLTIYWCSNVNQIMLDETVENTSDDDHPLALFLSMLGSPESALLHNSIVPNTFS
jgi:hypothetical protein